MWVQELAKVNPPQFVPMVKIMGQGNYRTSARDRCYFNKLILMFKKLSHCIVIHRNYRFSECPGFKLRPLKKCI